MPSLAKITLTSAADARGVIGIGPAVVRLNIPNSAETISAQTITTVDTHETLALPSNVVALVVPYDHYDLAGSDADATGTCTRLFTGTTALQVRCVNYTVGDANNPNAGLGIGYLAFMKPYPLHHELVGFT